MATDPKRDELVGCDGSVNGSTRADYGPMFDMKPENWDEWQFMAMLHLSNKGFAPWIDGSNRAMMTSADASIAEKYQGADQVDERVLAEQVTAQHLLIRVTSLSRVSMGSVVDWGILR